MDLDYIEQQIAEFAPETPEHHFATIGAVYSDGVTLIFDGEAQASAKHYKCNTSVYFRAGDRVRIFPDSGTYVVEYVVGSPAQAPTVGIPADGAKDQVLTKASVTDYDAGWATPRYVPASGSTGNVLTKTASSYEWAAVSAVPSGGTDGQVLKKVSGSPAWGNVREVPDTGTTGYVLTKTSGGYEFAQIGTAQDVKDTGSSSVIAFRNDHGRLQVRLGNTWTSIAYWSDLPS